MRILYKLASRSRVFKMFACLNNIISLSQHDDYIILVSLDVDDSTCYNEDTIKGLDEYGKKVVPVFGISANKISAINRDINFVNDWDILVNMSDDMQFIKEGFDLQIIADMKMYFPDTDGVLHYSDGTGNGERLITMQIEGRKYHDGKGYIYHPDYESWYSDNEETERAQMLKKYHFNPIQLFEHKHYLFKLDKPDELNKRNDDKILINKDKQTYIRRKAINFGIQC